MEIPQSNDSAASGAATGRTFSQSLKGTNGASAVERPTVLIISDDTEFSRAISDRWRMERNSPTFLMYDSASSVSGAFDLAIVGRTRAAEFQWLQKSAKPIVRVSSSNGHAERFSGLQIPEVNGWPELVITVAQQILQRISVAAELARVSEQKSQLEGEASLGRYILEMRHSLNNALTSILGNSELMLMDESVAPAVRLQLETIRNMGMRMNGILQRFSSLQKEMQLAQENSSKDPTRGAAAGI
jgi:signal transduction histidine kinase